MILFKELIPLDIPINTLTEDVFSNLQHLHLKLNFIRVLFNQPMVVTSGYRTLDHQKEIYAIKNQTRVKEGKPPLPVPMQSWHLYGAAADIADKSGDLKRWCLENLHILEELNLFCEAFDATEGWVHFQIYPPASGKRFFQP